MRLFIRVAPAVAFLLILGLPAAAQNQPVEFIQVISTTVRPEAVTEYEDYVKKIIAGSDKIGTAQRVLAYQVGLGGSPYTYHFVIPFAKWEELDSFVPIPQILSRAYGEVEGARILKSGRAAIERSESAVYRHMRNLSTRPRVNDPPSPFIMLVRTEIEPQMSASYERYLAKLKAAQEQESNTRSVNRSVSVLGPATVYLGANFFSKHAERDGWTAVPDLMRKAYGETEGPELTESSLRAVRKREIYILSHRPDLSRRPAAPPR